MANNQNKICSFLALICLSTGIAFGGLQSRGLNGQNLSSKTLRSMARIYLVYGQYDKAQRAARLALEKAQATPGDTEEMGMCLIDLGTVYSQQGMLTEAEQMLCRGVKYQAQALTDSHPYVAHTYRMICDVQRRQGKLDLARRSLTDAVAIMLESHTAESREMAPFYHESAKLLCAQRAYELSLATYEKALNLTEKQFGAGHLMTASVLIGVADLQIERGDAASAQAAINRAIEIQDRYYQNGHPQQVDAWLVKARLCRMQGDFTGSEAFIARAVRVTSQGRNVVAMAALHERINRLRTEGQVAAAVL
jgi:tetratricopeptide (TPR) repeat protein